MHSVHTADGNEDVEAEGTGVPLAKVGCGDVVLYPSPRESTDALADADGLADADLLDDLLAEADADGLAVDSPPMGADSCFARSFFAFGLTV